MQKNFTWILLGLAIAYWFFSDSANSLLDKWAEAIKRFEGWTTSSLSFRNNNPGNLRPSIEPWQGQIGVDSNHFVIFDSYDNGIRALKMSLFNAATGKSRIYHPSDSLYDFFDRYAPTSDNNYPRRYAEFVAAQLNVDPNIQISQLV
jgi:hypothetical protein